MDNHITYEQTIARFEENGIRCHTLSLSGGLEIIVSQRGGRILGPFAGAKRESVTWMNGAFSSGDEFRAFLESGDWNLGGDRIWIAPELQFNVKDRDDFFGSYALPEQVDPGRYSLSNPAGDRCVLEQDMALEVYGPDARGEKKRTKELAIRRVILPAADPLRELDDHDELVGGVSYGGWEHRITLTERKNDGLFGEAWDLTQVNPGGALYVATHPAVKHTDYYLPIDREYQQIRGGCVRLKIDGTRQYKVGYKAAHFLGRVAYHNAFEDGREYLLVRGFLSNPSAVYTKEPAEAPGCKGHPLHIYNDDNTYGGFAEVECSGQAIGGSTGRSSTEDQMLTWLYVGAPEKIGKIAWALMGIELSA